MYYFTHFKEFDDGKIGVAGRCEVCRFAPTLDIRDSGGTTMAIKKYTVLERLLAKINVLPNGCWEFNGSVDRGGYAWIWDDVKSRLAHRVSYREHKGEIPKDRPHIDHACHKPEECAEGRACPHRRCVNPDHLEAVTKSFNQHRTRKNFSGIAIKAAEHCSQLNMDIAARKERLLLGNPQYISKSEYAATTGINIRMLNDLLNDGSVEGIKIGRTWLVKRQDIE